MDSRFAVFVLLILTSAGAAWAQNPALTDGDELGTETPAKEPSDFAKRPWGVELQLGFASPCGLLAGAVDYSPIEYGTIAACAGWSLNGPQAAITPRLRLPITPTLAIGPEGGISAGRYGDSARFLGPCFMNSHTGCEDDDEQYARWSIAWWGNVAGFVEWRFSTREQRPSGSARLFVGKSFMLNPQDARCGGERCDAVDDSLLSLWYLGISVGGAFSLE